jgi:hypothetical protein
MTDRLVLIVPLVALLLTACRGSAPPQAAEEAAASASAQGSAHGLSPDLADAADELLTYIENNLLNSMASSEVRQPMVAEARQQLSELKDLNKTYEDRFVTRLLAMLLSKDNQRAGMLSLSDSADTRSMIGMYVTERDRCHSELLGWLEYREAATSSLRAGTCLREANKAAAQLGL